MFLLLSLRDSICHRALPPPRWYSLLFHLSFTVSGGCGVQIERDPTTLECPTMEGLFPAGEGAGYAGEKERGSCRHRSMVLVRHSFLRMFVSRVGLKCQIYDRYRVLEQV